MRKVNGEVGARLYRSVVVSAYLPTSGFQRSGILQSCRDEDINNDTVGVSIDDEV